MAQAPGTFTDDLLSKGIPAQPQRPNTPLSTDDILSRGLSQPAEDFTDKLLFGESAQPQDPSIFSKALTPLFSKDEALKFFLGKTEQEIDDEIVRQGGADSKEGRDWITTKRTIQTTIAELLSTFSSPVDIGLTALGGVAGLLRKPIAALVADLVSTEGRLARAIAGGPPMAAIARQLKREAQALRKLLTSRRTMAEAANQLQKVVGSGFVGSGVHKVATAKQPSDYITGALEAGAGALMHKVPKIKAPLSRIAAPRNRRLLAAGETTQPGISVPIVKPTPGPPRLEVKGIGTRAPELKRQIAILKKAAEQTRKRTIADPAVQREAAEAGLLPKDYIQTEVRGYQAQAAELERELAFLESPALTAGRERRPSPPGQLDMPLVDPNEVRGIAPGRPIVAGGPGDLKAPPFAGTIPTMGFDTYKRSLSAAKGQLTRIQNQIAEPGLAKMMGLQQNVTLLKTHLNSVGRFMAKKDREILEQRLLSTETILNELQATTTPLTAEAKVALQKKLATARQRLDTLSKGLPTAEVQQSIIWTGGTVETLAPEREILAVISPTGGNPILVGTLRIPRRDAEAYHSFLRQQLDNSNLSPSTRDTLQREADRIASEIQRLAPESLSRTAAANRLTKANIPSSSTVDPKASISQKMYEAYINFNLSALQTHTVNMSTTSFNLAAAPFKRGLAGLIDIPISKLQGRSRERFVQEAVASFWSPRRALQEATTNALRMAVEEKPTMAVISVTGRPHTKAIPGIPGRVVRTSGTVLGAEDEFTTTLHYYQALSAQSLRRAFEEGLHGQAALQRAESLINLNQKAFTSAQKAGMEGADLIEAARRYVEKTDTPTSFLVESAHKEALYYAFRSPFGKFGKRVQALRSTELWGLKPLEWLEPFMTTMTNLAKHGIEHAPYATIQVPRALGMLATKEGRAILNSAQLSDQLAKLTTGYLTLEFVKEGVRQGHITGNGPSDPNLRAQWMANGWKPNTLKLPGIGRRDGSRMQPFWSIFEITATIEERRMAHEYDDKTAAEEWLDALGIMSTALLSRNWLSGVRDVSTLISGGEDPEELKYVADRFVKNYLTSAIPRGIQQLNKITDPIQRSPRNLLENPAGALEDLFNMAVPGRSQNVRPRRDRFGKPISTEPQGPGTMAALQRYGSPAPPITEKATTPIAEGLKGVPLGISSPGRTLENPLTFRTEKLSDEDYENYERTSGALVEFYLGELVQDKRYKDLDNPFLKRKVASALVGFARSKASNAVIGPLKQTLVGEPLTPAEAIAKAFKDADVTIPE